MRRMLCLGLKVGVGHQSQLGQMTGEFCCFVLVVLYRDRRRAMEWRKRERERKRKREQETGLMVLVQCIDSQRACGEEKEEKGRRHCEIIIWNG